MKYKLLKEFAEKWFKALLSGEYKQGKNYLISRDPNGELRYCCLGVALHCTDEPVDDSFYDKYLNPSPGYINQFNKKIPNGIPDELYGIQRGSLPHKLSQLNDMGDLNHRNSYTFEEIVEWVKENVELY